MYNLHKQWDTTQYLKKYSKCVCKEKEPGAVVHGHIPETQVKHPEFDPQVQERKEEAREKGREGGKEL